MICGWDGTLYVNEEVKHRRENPGKAAMWAVAIAAGLFILAQIGLQGVTSLKNLNNNSTSTLVYLGDTLTGHSWGGQITAPSRLPCGSSPAPGSASRSARGSPTASPATTPCPRFWPTFPRGSGRRPWRPFVVSLILLALGWIYLLTTSVQNTFSYVLDNTGILYATFYCITALAAIFYYRRRVLSNVKDAITLGLLPVAGAWNVTFHPRLTLMAFKAVLGDAETPFTYAIVIWIFNRGWSYALPSLLFPRRS